MDIIALGPLELWDQERQFDLGSVKQRRVLGALLHARGEPVMVETLLDRVWNSDTDSLPTNPEASLQTYLSRLRNVLEEAGGERLRIERASPGRYQLRFDPEDVDLLRFQRLRKEAADAAERGERRLAIGKLHTAESEWRGEPLTEFTCDWALSLRARLREDHRHVQEQRIRLELELGRHADLLGELHELATRRPLDQRAVASLMLALYRSGRTTDALDRYRDTRRLLRDRQGIEPGVELRELHRRILAEDVVLMLTPDRTDRTDRTRSTAAVPDTPGVASDTPSAATSVPSAATSVPSAPLPAPSSATSPSPSPSPSPVPPAPEDGGAAAVRPPSPSPSRTNLPRDTRYFTGRTAELAALLAAPREDESEDESALPLTVIHGMPGVGKTALAVRAAYRLAPRYPDAQLHVDMRGHSDEPPCEPAEALSLLLRVAGALDDSPPAPGDEADAARSDVQALTGRWRAWTARHRALVVIDNAADPEHVRPLLPGSAGCRVLVTSRSRLTALDGADSLLLDVLPDDDAAALFSRVAGDTRKLDPEALRRVVRAFAGHPLAIQLLANGFRQHASWDLPYLAERIDRTRDPLDELETDTVPAAYRLSYAALGAPARRLLCRLALHPGPSLAPGAVAALMDSRYAENRSCVGELLHGHLIAEPACERYALHDLTRAFGRRTGEQEELADARRAAVARLLSYYMTAADRADRVVNPRRRRLRAEPAYESPYAPEFAQARDAWEWLSSERPNLLAAARTAAAHFPSYAARFPHVLAQLLKSWGAADTGELYAAAVAVLRERGDRTRLAQTMVDRADSLGQEGHTEALRCASEALTIFHALRDRRGCADAQLQRGRALLAAGRGADALEALDEALPLYGSLGAEAGTAEALNSLGAAAYFTGDFAAARGRWKQVLEIYEREADMFGQATALNNLGLLCLFENRYAEALHFFEESHTRVRVCGGPLDIALAEANLGAVHQATGANEVALAYFHRVLGPLREGGDSTGEADVRIHLGELHAEAGRYEEALAHYRRAEELSSRIGAAYEHQRVLVGIAATQRASGRLDAAMETYRRALRMAQDIGYALGEANALDGVARTELEADEPQAACRHGDRAMALYAKVDATDEAEALRGLLGGMKATGS